MSAPPLPARRLLRLPARTAIAARFGSSLAEYAGMSVIGASFRNGVIVWLWKRTVYAAEESARPL
jgi:hypothetical protein